MSDEVSDEVAVLNPESSNTVATFFWAGKPYEIKPGESRVMKPFLAEHARKHNGFLVVMDQQASAVEFAASRVKLAENQLRAATQQLESYADNVRKAQRTLDQAKANLKAKEDEDARIQDEERSAAQLAMDQAKQKAEAAAKARGAHKKE